MGKKISQLPIGTAIAGSEVLPAVQNGTTKKFPFSTVLAWLKTAITPADIHAVPDSRKINGYNLTADRNLTAADVGALAVDGTAVAANSLGTTWYVSGNAGWYKFMEIDMAEAVAQLGVSATAVNLDLFIQESGLSFAGILHCRFNVNTNLNFTAGTVGWISFYGTAQSAATQPSFVKFTFSNDTKKATLYIYKSSTSVNGVITISVLRRYARLSLIDISGWQKNESATLPADARLAVGPIATYDGNGDEIASTYLKTTDTAVSSKRLIADHTLSGASGWYHFLDIALTGNQSRVVDLLINSGNGEAGILRIYCFTISGGGTNSCNWLATQFDADTVKFEYANSTLSLYINKTSGSDFVLSFVVLSAINRSGTNLGSSILTWDDTAVTEPSSATAATANIKNNAATADLATRALTADSATYATTAGRATMASNADYAGRALSDTSGNTITTTYARKDGFLFFASQTVSAGTAQQILSISDTTITEDYVLARIEFANPAYITAAGSWATAAGSFTMTGTCTTATTANVLLVRKGN